MRDTEDKKGFFTLSLFKNTLTAQFNNWLTRLLINLNPPALKLAYAPVRIKEHDNLK